MSTKFALYIDEVGCTELARRLGVSKGTVSHWRSGRCRVSPARVRHVVATSGGVITSADVRPDLFGSQDAA